MAPLYFAGVAQQERHNVENVDSAGATPAAGTSLRSPRSGSGRRPRHRPRSAGDGRFASDSASCNRRANIFRRVVERIHASLRNSWAEAHAGANPVSPTNFRARSVLIRNRTRCRLKPGAFQGATPCSATTPLWVQGEQDSRSAQTGAPLRVQVAPTAPFFPSSSKRQDASPRSSRSRCKSS